MQHPETKMLRNALKKAGKDCVRIYADKAKNGYSFKIYATKATPEEMNGHLDPGYYLEKVPLPAWVNTTNIHSLRLHKQK